MALAIFLIWLTGAVGMYILDGYLDFGLEPLMKNDEYGVLLFALCIWWICLPIYLINKMRDAALSSRKKREERVKEVERVRVAAQREVDAAMEEMEKEPPTETRNNRWH